MKLCGFLGGQIKLSEFLVQNLSGPRIRPWTACGMSYNKYSNAKHDFVRRGWLPTWTERRTELNWVNFELNEMNFGN